MKRINDTKIYLYFSITTLILGIILGLLFSYSAFLVEPEINKLLSSGENISDSYRLAYNKLRSPQIFARYENFDRTASPIKTILKVYDEKIEKDETFDKNDKMYLQVLLDRRESGTRLTRNTMIFFFLLTVLGMFFYILDFWQLKKSK
ncbi:MAG: hypothetical protein JW864_00200 [Spirochaetes bacterium]|nr:hypothetical protein [Spirochaetota bacterium]